jgi:hypothetical protein
VLPCFPPQLDYAVTVEEYTLTKSANLVLNVDGCIGALFLDLLASSGAFTKQVSNREGATRLKGWGEAGGTWCGGSTRRLN